MKQKLELIGIRKGKRLRLVPAYFLEDTLMSYHVSLNKRDNKNA